MCIRDSIRIAQVGVSAQGCGNKEGSKWFNSNTAQCPLSPHGSESPHPCATKTWEINISKGVRTVGGDPHPYGKTPTTTTTKQNQNSTTTMECLRSSDYDIVSAHRLFRFSKRVWCTTQLAKLSFNHSNGRTHSWRFSTFYKNRIGFETTCEKTQTIYFGFEVGIKF